MSKTIEYIESLLSEIKTRRRRIAELGGFLEPDFEWACFPHQQAIELIENMADSYRSQQEKLEKKAVRAMNSRLAAVD